MAGFNTEDFTSKIITVVISVIVVAVVAIPIINQVITDNHITGTTATILGVIPIFLILAVLMAVVYMFLNNNKGFGN